jgi:NADPH:quinone reductase-like Zn-dependent oxidoreductase
VRALRLIDTAQGPALVAQDIPQPTPGPGELLIRVHAAGVTTTELQWHPTLHTTTGEKRVGAVPGHEFSGVIAEAGNGAGAFAPGQEVFGMNDWFADGAMAEYCIAPPSAIAPKPPSLTHVEAASIPIGALTAWQGLFDRAQLRQGERVLVHGGAGAVGIFAVQLAGFRGAHVSATASARNIELVKSLGAVQAIDYRKSRFEESVQDLDVVFDTAGGETLERSWAVLKPGGRMITIVSTAESSTDARVKKAFFIVEPNPKQLTEVGEMIETGRLRTVVDVVVPLSEAPAAYAGSVARGGRGKIVVSVAA